MQNVIMYCRKSSESEDRQAQSIDDQINILTKFAKSNQLTIIKTYSESKSAKAPYQRPSFTNLIADIQGGEGRHILCWSLDRLFRNPVDAGQVQWMLQQKHLHSIITPSKTYTIQDSGLMMSVMSGMANQFILDLSKNTKRGMQSKAEKGHYPSRAPIGYLNTPERNKGLKVLIKDPMRANLVRKVFEEILRGKQAAEVWDTAVHEWGLTTTDNHPLSKSGYYNMLNNPVYYGEYEWPRKTGNWYQGKHDPIITREEFDLVQKMLGKDGKPIAKTHQFDLTGLFRCNHCGCSVTGTKKVKYYKTTSNTGVYNYYHCTKKRRELGCTMPPITDTEANTQLYNQLLSIRPPQEFVDWAKKWVHVLDKVKGGEDASIQQSRDEQIKNIDKKLDNLLELRLSDGIDDTKYVSKKTELEKMKSSLLSTKDANQKKDTTKEINNTLDLALAAANKFKFGSREDKHFVLLRVGSNLTLKPKQIWVDLKPEYLALKDSDNWEERYKSSLEPQKYTEILSKYPNLAPANPVWLPR